LIRYNLQLYNVSDTTSNLGEIIMAKKAAAKKKATEATTTVVAEPAIAVAATTEPTTTTTEPTTTAKPKAEAKIKTSKPVKLSMMATIKQVIVREPKLPLEELVKRLDAAGFAGRSRDTIALIRSDVINTLKVAKEAGLYSGEM
jgi:hypothetical protein